MEIVFLLLIIVLLIIYLSDKEEFNNKCNCPYNTVCLDAENSYGSSLKSWCTTANINKKETNTTLSESTTSPNGCLSGSSRISGPNSYDSQSKSFCNKN
jgi:hypothetical protein